MSDLMQFIDEVGKAAQKHYAKYKILPSLCIAQALLESNKADYRKGLLKLSGLASDCHNYFGMKWSSSCGCKYKEYSTKEQRADGSYYTVVARFRKYDTLEDGVEGYFEFLQYKRYRNLQGVKDYKKACELIRSDGWATSLTYTQNLIKRIEELNLTRYDSFGSASTEYYPKYNGNSNSIVSALNSLGIESNYNSRKKIAVNNGINDYSGTANQNTYLLSLLKQGKLRM